MTAGESLKDELKRRAAIRDAVELWKGTLDVLQRDLSVASIIPDPDERLAVIQHFLGRYRKTLTMFLGIEL